MKRIGILTGGGDAPGLNAVIRAVVKSAHNAGGYEVLGIRDGFDGCLEPNGLVERVARSVVEYPGAGCVNKGLASGAVE